MPNLVAGIGINDATYVVNNKGKLCPIYSAWNNMLKRCYNLPYQLKLAPSYRNCSVINEWHSFTVFSKWMLEQDWKNKHIDKDLLVSHNKIYSPATCIFVDSAINKLLNIKCKRSVYPTGVYKRSDTGAYVAQCRQESKHIFLGNFKTITEAATAYLNFKARVVEQAAIGQTDLLLKTALLRISQEIKQGTYYE